MRIDRLGMIAGGALWLAAAGCTSITPQGPTIGLTPNDANPYRRGSPEFCERYAGQTFTNTFETNTDTTSSDAAGQQARVSGGEAYRRCLSGRTN